MGSELGGHNRLINMLGPFICCKRNIIINPPGPDSAMWHINKEGGDPPLQSSAEQTAINDFKNNPDGWEGPRQDGSYTKSAEFCGSRFNGWI